MKLPFHENRIRLPEGDLWAAVIDQALEDLLHQKLHQAAVEWFTSTAHGPGSFRWACDHLDLNASAIWAALHAARKLEERFQTRIPGVVKQGNKGNYTEAVKS